MYPDFLAQFGITNPDGQFIYQPAHGTSNSAATAWFTPLTDLGLLTVAGEDAASFLHGQLTNDIKNLAPNHCQWAGYCSAKGRLLASFLHWQTLETQWLQLDRALLPAIQKRLSMFVLRAKAKLQDASNDYLALGVFGADAAAKLSPYLASQQLTLPQQAYQQTSNEHLTVQALPWGWQLIVHNDAAEALWQGLQAAGLQATHGSAWASERIRAGIAHIVAATQDQYVPQMVNFELVGGVNFKKGCYPGQEVVARSQYLGKLKRRMAVVRSSQALQVGADVYAAAQGEHSSSPNLSSPIGTIVNAAACAHAPDQWVGLVEAPLELHTAVLHAHQADGPVLTVLPLPYAIPANEPVQKPNL